MKMKLKKTIVMKFRDIALQYRMGAGFAGDVTRTHPTAIEPAMVGTSGGSVPPTQYGIPVLVDASNGIRQFAAGDTAITVPYGFIVRPYPVQAQQTTNYGSANIGSATPPTAGVVDIQRSGTILAPLNSAAGTPTKGGPVFVWCAATTAGHTQGGLETVASSGNTAALDPNRWMFNGPADASGLVEISNNV